MAEPYESFVELTSIVDLDLPRLLPFSCMMERSWDHLDSLTSVTITPFALFALGSALVRCSARRRSKAEREERAWPLHTGTHRALK